MREADGAQFDPEIRPSRCAEPGRSAGTSPSILSLDFSDRVDGEQTPGRSGMGRVAISVGRGRESWPRRHSPSGHRRTGPGGSGRPASTPRPRRRTRPCSRRADSSSRPSGTGDRARAGRLPGQPGRAREGRRGDPQGRRARPTADPAARLAEPVRPRRLGRRRRLGEARRSRPTPTTCSPAGSRPGCWRPGAARQGGRGLEVVRRPLQRADSRELAKDADALLIVGQAAERYYPGDGPAARS